MAITDTAVHDIDTTRWLLGEEIVAARVLKPRKNSLGGELEDPLLIVFETESGALVDVETNVNIRYGYDIRGEIVGEQGTVSLAESTPTVVAAAASFTGRVTAGLAGTVHPRLRHRIPGMDRRHRGQAVNSAPAHGTGTPPPRSPMRPSRPCTTIPGSASS